MIDVIKFDETKLHRKFMDVAVKAFPPGTITNISVIHDHWDTFQEGAEESVYCHDNLESAMEPLVQFLKESKGWMRDYSTSIILDAIDRNET